jgi:hypothetical protein
LTKFDLNFPGGTPGELVTAIQTAMGQPLNAIVPNEDANVKLPPLKMKNVDVAHLFRALLLASHHREAHREVPAGHTSSYSYKDVFYGFRTDGEVTNDSIWFFHDDRVFPSKQSAQSARFYLLTTYLDRGMTADAITAAIQTSWKMLGASTTPSISFQKETNLLIAVGKPSQLNIIDSVLKALGAHGAHSAEAASPAK